MICNVCLIVCRTALIVASSCCPLQSSDNTPDSPLLTLVSAWRVRTGVWSTWEQWRHRRRQWWTSRVWPGSAGSHQTWSPATPAPGDTDWGDQVCDNSVSSGTHDWYAGDRSRGSIPDHDTDQRTLIILIVSSSLYTETQIFSDQEDCI